MQTSLLTIYIASKTKHAHRWRDLRAKGFRIISTWIDEAGPGETKNKAGLANRCILESIKADRFILYCEPGETLKGALIEVGARLASGHPVVCVGKCDSIESCFAEHHLWQKAEAVEQAILQGNYFMPAAE